MVLKFGTKTVLTALLNLLFMNTLTKLRKGNLNCFQNFKRRYNKKIGIEIGRLNDLLPILTENRIIEFIFTGTPRSGYKICAHFGIAAYMLLAAG